MFAAYVPDKQTGTARADGMRETSISWEDNPQVLDRISSDDLNARFGVARLSRVDIEYVARRARLLRCLEMERQPMGDNPHHGNILFDGQLANPIQRMLAENLALHAEFLPRPK
jgi:hypothetical protein